MRNILTTSLKTVFQNILPFRMYQDINGNHCTHSNVRNGNLHQNTPANKSSIITNMNRKNCTHFFVIHVLHVFFGKEAKQRKIIGSVFVYFFKISTPKESCK